jgi:hypothetical protein
MPKIDLLSIDSNVNWKVLLLELINTLDDLLPVFGIRRRAQDAAVNNTIARWADADMFSVFDHETKQHIGICGWYSHNPRLSAVNAWCAIAKTNDRNDEPEIKKQAYWQLCDKIFAEAKGVDTVCINLRTGSKDDAILKDMGFTAPEHTPGKLFVDGKFSDLTLFYLGKPE